MRVCRAAVVLIRRGCRASCWHTRSVDAAARHPDRARRKIARPDNCRAVEKTVPPLRASGPVVPSGRAAGVLRARLQVSRDVLGPRAPPETES